MEPKEIQELVEKGVTESIAPLVSRVEALETTAKERADKEATVAAAAEKEAADKAAAEKEAADKVVAEKEAAEKEAADKAAAEKAAKDAVDPTLKAIDERIANIEAIVTKSKGLPPTDEAAEAAEKAEKPNRDGFGRRLKH